MIEPLKLSLEPTDTKPWQAEEAFRRYQIVAPLLDDSLGVPEKQALRSRLAEQNDLSTRTLYRYEQAYRAGGFQALQPMNRKMRRRQDLPDNFDDLVVEAIQLKKEVPSRSVERIILILEMEGRVAPGVLKRSTLQRYLYKAGLGKKQMKKAADVRNASARRFCKPHRMMLTESDIKYGPKLPIGKNKALVQTYLVAIIDDHSRYVLYSGFYASGEAWIVEDAYRNAILSFGAFDSTLVDNGKQFISRQLICSLSRLGIRHQRCKPYHAWSKGVVEKFNFMVSGFLDEARAQKIKTLEDLNHHWKNWVEQYYQKTSHDGIREYYESQGVEIPAGGLSPEQEFNRDSRPLKFLDAAMVGEAFLHHETRVVDKGGCISFKGRKYETHTSLIGAEVEIAYDPAHTQELTVSYNGIEPFRAKPLVIGEWASRKADKPVALLSSDPEYSRFLAGLEQKAQKSGQAAADAISFSSYRKDGDR